jgi:hypothetical protein
MADVARLDLSGLGLRWSDETGRDQLREGRLTWLELVRQDVLGSGGLWPVEASRGPVRYGRHGASGYDLVGCDSNRRDTAW